MIDMVLFALPQDEQEDNYSQGAYLVPGEYQSNFLEDDVE